MTRRIFNIRLTAAQCELIANALFDAAETADATNGTDEVELLAEMFDALDLSPDVEPTLCDFADDMCGGNAS